MTEEDYKNLQYLLPEKDRGSLSSLNAITPRMMRRIRGLKNASLMIIFLQFYLPPNHHPFISSFVINVVLKKGNPAIWKKGAIWFPDVSLKHQLTQTLAQHFAPFLNEIRFMVPPDLQGWHQGDYLSGCFVFPDPSRTYLTEKPPGFSSHGPDLKMSPVPPDKIPILFRRWIAQRIARYLLSKNAVKFPVDLGLLEEIAEPSQWTHDAQKAIDGLNRELQQGVDLKRIVPGYGGPDEWYL